MDKTSGKKPKKKSTKARKPVPVDPDIIHTPGMAEEWKSFYRAFVEAYRPYAKNETKDSETR